MKCPVCKINDIFIPGTVCKKCETTVKAKLITERQKEIKCKSCDFDIITPEVYLAGCVLRNPSLSFKNDIENMEGSFAFTIRKLAKLLK